MPLWRYTDSTTGKEIICNNINYFLQILVEELGLQIPSDFCSSIITKRVCIYSIPDVNGAYHNIQVKRCIDILYGKYTV